MEGRTTEGMWSIQERDAHINLLELMGGAFAVRTFAKRLRMDNCTAVSYINHLGGTRSLTLTEHAKDLWTWCLQRGIMLSAECLPGSLNTAADTEFRTLQSSGEWSLHGPSYIILVQSPGQQV
jgi:hypothetical protein